VRRSSDSIALYCGKGWPKVDEALYVIKYFSTVSYEPVTKALTFIRVIFNPEGDGAGGQAGLHVTLMKVKSNNQG